MCVWGGGEDDNTKRTGSLCQQADLGRQSKRKWKSLLAQLPSVAACAQKLGAWAVSRAIPSRSGGPLPARTAPLPFFRQCWGPRPARRATVVRFAAEGLSCSRWCPCCPCYHWSFFITVEGTRIICFLVVLRNSRSMCSANICWLNGWGIFGRRGGGVVPGLRKKSGAKLLPCERVCVARGLGVSLPKEGRFRTLETQVEHFLPSHCAKAI